jgi:hypothetical protein
MYSYITIYCCFYITYLKVDDLVEQHCWWHFEVVHEKLKSNIQNDIKFMYSIRTCTAYLMKIEENVISLQTNAPPLPHILAIPAIIPLACVHLLLTPPPGGKTFVPTEGWGEVSRSCHRLSFH